MAVRDKANFVSSLRQRNSRLSSHGTLILGSWFPCLHDPSSEIFVKPYGEFINKKKLTFTYHFYVVILYGLESELPFTLPNLFLRRFTLY